MEITAEQIAGMIDGNIEGKKDVVVNDLSKIEEGRPGTLSFLANPKYNNYLYDTEASVVIINKDMDLERSVRSTCTLIRVDDAYKSFAVLLDYYNKFRLNDAGIDEQAVIDKQANLKEKESIYIGAMACICSGASIGKNVKIYPQAFIGKDVHIGDNTVIFPGVKIMDGCSVGNNCMIQAGAVIGSDGFGFAQEDGTFSKVPQIGNVILEDDVEVGANTTIDRATMGSTIIRKGVKLDNLIQIAHNVEIGQNSAVAAQAGVAGSAKVGKQVLLGGQVGVSGHIKIADNVMIAAQSGIPNNIKKEGVRLIGSPAFDLDDFKKSYFGFRKLPYLLKKVRELEDVMNKMKVDKRQ